MKWLWSRSVKRAATACWLLSVVAALGHVHHCEPGAGGLHADVHCSHGHSHDSFHGPSHGGAPADPESLPLTPAGGDHDPSCAACHFLGQCALAAVSFAAPDLGEPQLFDDLPSSSSPEAAPPRCHRARAPPAV